MTYFRATDPFPLESADHTKLHEFYARLGEGRLVTTRCAACGTTAWPPRGFFDYAGDRRDTFETAKIRALLRQLKRDRESAP